MTGMTTWTFALTSLIDSAFYGNVLFKTTVLLTLAWIVYFCFLRMNPKFHLLLWRGTAITLLLVPFVVLFSPAINVNVEKNLEAMTPSWSLHASHSPASVKNIPPAQTQGGSSNTGTVQTQSATNFSLLPVLYFIQNNWISIITYVWISVSFILFIRLIVGYVTTFRLVKRSFPANEFINTTCQTISKVLDCRKIPEVRIQPQINSPSVAGFFHPVILLPDRFNDSNYQQDITAVLVHEISHWRNNDLAWSFILQLLSIFYWIHPLFWRIPEKHASACETVSDVIAADYVGNVNSYTKTLARIALETWGYTPIFSTAIPMARTSEIYRRVQSLPENMTHKLLKKRTIYLITMGLVCSFFLLSIIHFSNALNPENLPRIYEKAPSTQDLKMELGPNTLGIQAIVRNDRGGSLHFEDGAGNPFQELGFKVNSNFVKQAPWLDLANIYLNLDDSLFDVIELRIFDHATRELLFSKDDAITGFGMAYPSVVQIRSAYAPLPDVIDIWMRLHSYREDDPVYRLPAEQGSEVSISQGSLSIREVKKGFHSYSMSDGTIKWGDSTDENIQTTVVLDFNGKWVDGRYQVCAVGKNGNKYFPGTPHFIDFNRMEFTQVINFPIQYEQLQFIEVRPYGGRHRFFFDGVKLPTISGESLSPPATVTFPINGKETKQTSLELDPIRITLQTLKGDRAHGSSTTYNKTHVKIEEAGKDMDSKTTIIYTIGGLSVPSCKLNYEPIKEVLRKNSPNLDPSEWLQQHIARSTSANAVGETSGFEVMPFPLNTLQTINLKIAPPK